VCAVAAPGWCCRISNAAVASGGVLSEDRWCPYSCAAADQCCTAFVLFEHHLLLLIILQSLICTA
jgi:hypothetical protein